MAALGVNRVDFFGLLLQGDDLAAGEPEFARQANGACCNRRLTVLSKAKEGKL